MQAKIKNEGKKVESHYQTLEVPVTATAEEIKKSFKSLALKYHPDKCSDPNAATKMQRLNEAYKVLSSETQRRKYDLLFEAGGDAGDLSDESFEYEDEVILEMPDEVLRGRWKKLVLGMESCYFFYC
jgi:curved DNA-binding protein CbpA